MRILIRKVDPIWELIRAAYSEAHFQSETRKDAPRTRAFWWHWTYQHGLDPANGGSYTG